MMELITSTTAIRSPKALSSLTLCADGPFTRACSLRAADDDQT
jgi:hypothetical protein